MKGTRMPGLGRGRKQLAFGRTCCVPLGRVASVAKLQKLRSVAPERGPHLLPGCTSGPCRWGQGLPPSREPTSQHRHRTQEAEYLCQMTIARAPHTHPTAEKTVHGEVDRRKIGLILHTPHLRRNLLKTVGDMTNRKAFSLGQSVEKDTSA